MLNFVCSTRNFAVLLRVNLAACLIILIKYLVEFILAYINFRETYFSWPLCCWLTFNRLTIFLIDNTYYYYYFSYLFLIFNYARIETFAIFAAMLPRIQFFWNSMLCHCVRIFQLLQKSLLSQLRPLITQQGSMSWILYNSINRIFTWSSMFT